MVHSISRACCFHRNRLAAYALGLPAFVLVKVLAPAFFARGDTSTPVKIGVACVVLNSALNLAFMVPLAHIGPALATSLAAICNVGGLAFILLRRGHFLPDQQLRRRCLGMIGASVAMAGRLWGFGHYCSGRRPTAGYAALAGRADRRGNADLRRRGTLLARTTFAISGA